MEGVRNPPGSRGDLKEPPLWGYKMPGGLKGQELEGQEMVSPGPWGSAGLGAFLLLAPC